MDVSLALAFIAGLISFATPCVLALVPVYLAFLGGEAATAPAAAPAGSGPRGTLTASVVASGGTSGANRGTSVVTGTGPLLGQALLFCLGFAAVFVTFAVSVGLLGRALFAIEPLRQAAGVLVIALGVLTTGAFGPVLDRLRSPLTSSQAPTVRSARSLTLGALFAVGWTPCVGPVLGAILMMGASSQQVGAAVLLLGAYSAGLALPFLAAALALPQLRPVMHALRRNHRAVELVAGLFIVAMGVLIFFDVFSRMATLFVLL